MYIFLQKAHKLTPDIDDKEWTARNIPSVSLRLGTLLLIIDAREEAEKYFKDAVEYAKLSGEEELISETEEKIAEVKKEVQSMKSEDSPRKIEDFLNDMYFDGEFGLKIEEDVIDNSK